MVGNNIKRIREQKSISVNELSRLSGVNASYISALERGKKNNPSLDILQKIADALEITPKDLTSEPFANEKIPPNKFKSTCIDAGKSIIWTGKTTAFSRASAMRLPQGTANPSLSWSL